MEYHETASGHEEPEHSETLRTIDDVRAYALDVSIPVVAIDTQVLLRCNRDTARSVAQYICRSALFIAEKDGVDFRIDLETVAKNEHAEMCKRQADENEAKANDYFSHDMTFVRDYLEQLYGAYTDLFYQFARRQA